MNDLVSNASNEKLIQLLEEQLTHIEINKIEDLLKQIEALSHEQVRQLTKLYMAQNQKNQSTKLQMDKVLYLKMTRLLTNLSTQKNKARTPLLIQLFVKLNKKKRNDSFRDGVEIEEIHHHPEILTL